MKTKLVLSVLLLTLIFSFEYGMAQAPGWAWAKSGGGTNSGNGRGITTDASGNVYVTGEFYGPSITFDTITLSNAGVNDIFIVKYDNTGNVLWAQKAGGTLWDYEPSIVTDASGNVYVTGGFVSPTITFGSITLTNAGTTDFFIVKYDGSGNMLWAKSAGGTGYESGKSIATDASGNVYITGDFNSPSLTFGSTTLTPTSAGYEDIFTVKYDGNGNALWAKSAGGTDVDRGVSIATDASGNACVTSWFRSPTATFDSTTLTNTSSNHTDIAIVKYDGSGNLLWAKSAGGPYGDTGSDITTDASGNVYLTGSFNSTITFDSTTLINPQGVSDIFTVKYDGSGNVLWAKRDSGLSYSFGTSIATDGSGNVYVTGVFENFTMTFDSITLTNTSAGYEDIFIVKYDGSGNVLWATSVGGANDDHVNGMTSDASGNVYGTGYFNSPSITFGSITLTNISVFVAKLSCMTTATINQVACNNYTSPSGNYNWTTSGIYMDTIQNATGCDTIITINLTINNSTSSSQTDTACTSYASPSGNYNWTTSGIYTDTIPNATGCDSIITINLTINNTSSLQTDTACNSYTSPSGNYNWTTSGTYTDTIPNSTGCDSIITINLTINNTSSLQTDTACNSYTSPSGNYNWTTSGTYTDTIPNSTGCDSIMTINLTINNVDTTVTQIDNALTANASGAAYQWLDCDSGYAPINGATSQVFIPLFDGNYAVAVTQNGCTDTSSCFTILGTGINENVNANSFTVIPNPATDYITINTNSNKKQVITISDITGQLIYSTTTLSDKTIINTKDFQQGVYAVQVQAGDAVQTIKVVVVR